MRWVVTQPGPEWSVHDVYVGWVEALRGLGEHVFTFELGDYLSFYGGALLEDPAAEKVTGRKAVKQALTAEQSYEVAADRLTGTLWKIRPDVLLIVTGSFFSGQMLDHARRNHGIKVVILHTEQPYELERELALAAHADLNLINDPTHLHAFEQVAPTVYAPHAYREKVHHPGPAIDAYACDFAFVGTGFGSRRWFFERLAETGALADQDVVLAGPYIDLEPDSPIRDWIKTERVEDSVDNDITADLYRSARCSMNLYRRESDSGKPVGGWSMGPREVELAACQTFFLRDPRPEGDQMLSMLPTFTGPAEAAELLRWWLDPAHDDQRLKAARLAREAIADRTFTEHGRQLLGLLDRVTVAR